MISIFQQNPELYFAWVSTVIFSICCHEYAHARVALWQGDDTAAKLGHLTLNPLKQMGLFSLFMCLFIGFAFGLTPVNPSRFKHKYSDALVSFSGPFTNLVLFMIFGFLSAVTIVADLKFMQMIFRVGAMVNIFLFVLNMLPIPPFDGGTVASSFIPPLKALRAYQGMILMILIALMFLTPAFDYLFSFSALIGQSYITLLALLFDALKGLF